jgi:phosphatidylethanolamine-binding protein (PEBP) family uncharacterized protein
VATIGVVSIAQLNDGTIAAPFTCHGKDLSPQLFWRGAAGTLENAKELLVVARTFTKGHRTWNWAVAGISPTVDRIRTGKLPAGAVVGRNSFGKVGYEVCPPSGALITIAVYALPRNLHLKPGFNPETLLPVLGSGEVQWGTVMMNAPKQG